MKIAKENALEKYPICIEEIPEVVRGGVSYEEKDINKIYRNICEKSFEEGVLYTIKLFEEEIANHDCPEHAYFCDCLYGISNKLKQE